MSSVPSRVIELIETFDRNIEAYKNQQYNEAQLRREFIDPFFEELGWDVTNKAGLAQAYKDVIHEDAIKIGGYTKAPDYCFRIGGTRKFFLESKKPSIDIKGDPHPAYQLRRYAWSAKLPLSILTDFEEFAVYDCQTRPKHIDKAATARIMYLNYKHYPDQWDKIASIFSKNAILKGSFDKFAVTTKGKRGTTTVDIEFLAEIEKWRRMLARTITLRNIKLSKYEINFAVQRTIDRIIFLRMCEDRAIEHYGQLLSLSSGREVYKRLCQVFERSDAKYNSGLFHFRKEPGRAEEPDELTPNLVVDDTPIGWILRSLYYPDCPYEFSVLPAEILGNVYEQFLGKVIRITPGHQAKIEEKPEVKKAGGIYYTPSYIVDYIVKNTVGKLLGVADCHCEERSDEAISTKLKTKHSKLRTPAQVKDLRILDPACGSGSFLLAAYTYLLNYHRDWYVDNNPEKHTKKIYQGRGGQWFLTIAEKKKILLDNIFGVDIDSQAVEVTKLSLLLKVLEGESAETVGQTYKMFHERALPDLGYNIKCGNSLIGPDFYENKDPGSIDSEEYRRINPFDWQAEFPQVFSRKKLGAKQRSAEASAKADGFDAVIGNPPYVRPHNLPPVMKDYFWDHYPTFVKKSDLYCCFIEKAVSLLNQGGRFGNIVSNGWLRLDSFENLRTLLLHETAIEQIIEFTHYVFERTNVKTAIIILTKPLPAIQKIDVAITDGTTNLTDLQFKRIKQSAFKSTYKSIFDLSLDKNQEAIKKKMRSKSAILGDMFNISFGLKTGDDSKFLTYSPNTPDHKRLLRGENVHRYSYNFKGEYVWYVPLKMRTHRKTARPGTPERFEQPKVLVRDTGGRLEANFDGNNYYVKDVLVVADKNKDPRNLLFLLGIFNSKLMKFYYETSFPTLHVQRDEIASLPICSLDAAISTDKAKHDKMVKLVERMLDLHKRLVKAKVPAEKTRIQRQINTTDSQIDKLVYQLYNLTPEEIKIVEQNT